MAVLLNSIGFGTFSFGVRSIRLIYFLPVLLCFFFSAGVSAQQDDNPPENLAPPPLRVISKEEKNALAGVSDIKERTNLAINLMEARIKKAEELNSGESHSELLAELGVFQALMDDALKFLNRNDNGGGKVMNNYKKFEMALRAFMPRIELIRRDLPDEFEYHVRRLLKVVRETRAKAVEPFFGQTVVPDKNY